MKSPSVLAFVLAGGEGRRLRPLTTRRCKPAIPFSVRYKVVDFVLSNLVNSGINRIYLLTQYKSQTLIDHIRNTWLHLPAITGGFITAISPQIHAGPEYQGTAEAVYRNLEIIRHHKPDLVAIFCSDHIYRMDVRSMVRFHLENEADVSIAAFPVPVVQASAFGVMVTDRNGRVCDFEEKPARPTPIPGDQNHVYASMGNYVFNTRVLTEALHEAHRLGKTDFGGDILPQLLKSRRMLAYDFASYTVPGIKPYENHPYWRNMGTIESYFAANQDTLGLKPRFDLSNPEWQIFSSCYQGPVAKIIKSESTTACSGPAL